MDAPEKDPGIPEELKVQCDAPPEPEDPGIPEDLKVQCDAPPEPQILTAHDQEILEHPQDNPENVGQAEKKGDLEGQEKIAAPVTASASEIAPDPDDPHEIAPEPHEPREMAPEPIDDMIRSWKDAIESENVLELLGILEKIDRPALVTLELENRSRDRTALHVAAKSNHVNNFSLAEAIFDKLLGERWLLRYQSVSFQRRLKRTIIEYIIAVEKGSEKTAMELALKKNQRFLEYINGIQKKMLPHIQLWEEAIAFQSVDALLEILGEGSSDLLGLELDWARRGRTALHIAAKSNHPERVKLAKAILDRLLESRQESGTESISWQPDTGKNILHTVDEYIEAKDSEKTARELAEESNNERIVEYIDAFPSSEVQKLWEGAIASQNVDVLMKIYGQRTAHYILDLERDGLGRGRTALHIAAKSDHPESLKLAKAILDHLLVSQEDRYTDAIFGNDVRITVGQYISAVEREDSKKTAMELAKESKKQDIVEYIVVTQKQSAEHAKIDRDVAIFEQLVHYYDEDDFKPEYLITRIQGKRWLRKAIAARDCSLLMKAVKALQSNPTANLKYDGFWKCDGESGRTMLHVAAMQGCFPLAKTLLDYAREWKDSKFVEAIDGLSGLNAFEMANNIIGNRSIAQYVIETLKHIGNENYDHPSCFYEAYQGSQWRMILASGFSSSIIYSLERNKHLMLETYEGCTVLHVAILCQDRSLVEMLLNMFGPEKRISFGGSCFPSELTWQEMLDRKVEIDKSLFDVTWPAVFLSEGYCRLPFTCSFKGSAMELIQHMEKERGANSNDEAIPTLLELYDKKPGKFTEPVERSFGLGSKIVEKWKREWDRGYVADVDFNFEVEPRFTLLKFHYACKYPFKFKEFLKSTFCIEDLSIGGWNLSDAQGRSVYHIMQDYCNNQDHYPSPTILNEIFGEGSSYYKVVGDEARALKNILFIKNYLHHNILLEDIKLLHCDFNITKNPREIDDVDNVDKELEHDYGLMTLNDYISYFMLYHVTTALKQTDVAQHIWFNILEKNPSDLKKLCKLDWVPFFAASTGNQVMLRFLLENLINLTITDAKKRTLLHHAANPTLLDFDVLLKCAMIGHCFSTVKDVCDVRRKWNTDRKKTSMIFPSKISDKDFDVGKHVTSLNMERKACILLLLEEGVDLSHDENMKVPMIGPTDDTGHQSWWYDMVAKDFIDKRNDFNQAASALSVVGTLVAATSYIGPLQPPMSFTGDGFLHGNALIKVFMMSNTLAFIFAMTSVIFAVVPSLPMSRESARLELKRAKSIMIHSLYMLLSSIFFIIISFGVASMVVMRDQNFSSGSIWVFVPLLIGCIICPIAIVSFLGRVLRLRFPNSSNVRRLYQFKFRKS